MISAWIPGLGGLQKNLRQGGSFYDVVLVFGCHDRNTSTCQLFICSLQHTFYKLQYLERGIYLEGSWLKKALYILLALAAVWLGIRFVLPVVMPFLLGGLLALAAEPVVELGVSRLGMRRSVATGLGVTLTLLGLAAILAVVGAVAVRQLGDLASNMPDMTDQVQSLEQWLLQATERAPEGLRNLAQKTVTEVFDGNTPLLEQAAGKVPAMLTAVASGVGSSVLAVGTGLLSAFLISVRLPRLRSALSNRLPKSWHEKYLPALRRVRHSLFLWLKAQGKLSLVTWGIVTLGLWILGVDYALFVGALVAVVDAVPLLGTGTVLVPWAVFSLIRGEDLRGIGLLCVYGAAAITRTVLEPRIVGRQLGLDPLLTLLSLYVGFRLWGVPGLLLTPILVSAAISITRKQ